MMTTKTYNELLDDLESYNQRTKTATEAYELALSNIQTVSSSAFTYDISGALTEMTETTPGGDRVTTFTYEDGNLTQSVEVFGGITKTTTYDYSGGNLIGVTTV